MTKQPGGTGPLAGLRVVEFAGLAPAPFACMVLADLGADVLCIERAASDGDRAAAVVPPPGATRVLTRGRRSVAVDLKAPGAVPLVLDLVERADVLVEGFRPGVMERLGLGPDACARGNPRLVYGRMTGWGQDGPLRLAAGHDINYIALAGALHLVGRPAERPVPPANLLGDFGGGGLLLAFGILAALFERERSGRGQVVDAAMVDGAVLLTTFIHGLRHSGAWSDARGVNLLDGGAPYYDTYETSDGSYVAVGAVEPQFFAELMTRLEIPVDPATQNDAATWPELRRRIADRFRSRTRDEWCRVLEGSDACFAPVESLDEVACHPHHQERRAFIDVGGVRQPAPAPRFSRTPPGTPTPPPPVGGDGLDALAWWGVSGQAIAAAAANHAVYVPAAHSSGSSVVGVQTG